MSITREFFAKHDALHVDYEDIRRLRMWKVKHN